VLAQHAGGNGIRVTLANADRAVAAPLLEARALRKHFAVKGRNPFSMSEPVRAVDGVDFAVLPGETLSLVGESGCGKTTTSRLLLGLEAPTAGAVYFEGRDIAALDRPARRVFRAGLQAVFQDPASSLSPRMRVEEIVGEPLIANAGLQRPAIRERVGASLADVGLPPDAARRYPHEFSGGQRQRIAIARALLAGARCVILDEPVSALDVSIRAQILNLLKRLQAQHGLTYILISHDLAAVRYLSTRIGVMYLGRIVEIAPTATLYSAPRHPYTRALLDAVLPLAPATDRDTPSPSGEVPSARRLPTGCRFHPRCSRAEALCREQEPALSPLTTGRAVACHFPLDTVPTRPEPLTLS
jgi:oligopeptide/dipeptide ABC transporter ATP-binding protein